MYHPDSGTVHHLMYTKGLGHRSVREDRVDSIRRIVEIDRGSRVLFRLVRPCPTRTIGIETQGSRGVPSLRRTGVRSALTRNVSFRVWHARLHANRRKRMHRTSWNDGFVLAPRAKSLEMTNASRDPGRFPSLASGSSEDRLDSGARDPLPTVRSTSAPRRKDGGPRSHPSVLPPPVTGIHGARSSLLTSTTTCGHGRPAPRGVSAVGKGSIPSRSFLPNPNHPSLLLSSFPSGFVSKRDGGRRRQIRKTLRFDWKMVDHPHPVRSNRSLSDRNHPRFRFRREDRKRTWTWTDGRAREELVRNATTLAARADPHDESSERTVRFDRGNPVSSDPLGGNACIASSRISIVVRMET